MPKQKYYAVRKGRAPGIYQSWEACAAQVTGYPGAVYKSFESRDQAERFLRAGGAAPSSSNTKPRGAPVVRRVAATRVEPVAAEAAPVVGTGFRLYTDGGCLVNPGPGGYAVVLVIDSKRKELSGGFRRTTNNRMELMACIVGLEAVRTRTAMTIYTDSTYLANGIAKGWAKRWQALHWQRAGAPVPNADLWQRLLALCAQRTVTFEWLRGHAGHPENERCHVLADEAMRRPGLPPDPGYEPASE